MDPARIAGFHALLPELRAVRDRVEGTAGGGSPAEAVRELHLLTERFDRTLIDAVRAPPLAGTIADTRGQTTRLRAIAHAAPGGRRSPSTSTSG